MDAQARSSGLRLLALGAAAALAFAACGGKTATPTPAPTQTPAPTIAATVTPTPTPTATGCDLTAADTAMQNLASYQFKMTLAGGAADALQDLPPYGEANAYTLKGTIVNKPAPAADITLDKFHIIEIGGADYQDAEGDGSFIQLGGDNGGGDDSGTPTDTPAASDSASPDNSGLVSTFAPEEMFDSGVVGSGSGGAYTLAGTETKNGVQTNHCTADQIALESYGSTLGVTDATWTADVWLASDTGYPVSVALVAKAKDGSLPFEILIDLTNVNDASNKVAAPTNISGA